MVVCNAVSLSECLVFSFVVSVVTLGFLVTMGPPALLRCNVRVSVR